MRIIFSKSGEHLPYILASAVWHYLQHSDKILNSTHDQEEIAKILAEQKIIKEVINPAVKNPVEGERFAVECEDAALINLLVRILQYYLDETKDILKTIEDPEITKRCLLDVEIIEKELITAIKIAG
ncbi:MAG: hypothetical protein ACOY3H_07750 [Bacillota bacterium]|uniref:Uncharacterized protein n=2 Tax=Carboxydocella TaxID=178898 RepID=A0A1T4QS26_9FIRM|nr:MULTISPECIES: hypothetical protein [Carboxydocella]AVX20830.1 hypothetical protein CFE_1655 [Carboxydocella thermautotrophica]AVX31249.1 hypothetical protein CTH_1673 [Carboxydocella thermautotrophica]SKA06476.1 hypothetical protein SAMN02745885_01776 [Carboxydocella sporoproducens DSM 16521]GAW30000.1 hypothetical protein ULO1_25700 [Carboxydocella sp. ULO1]GAW30397.1 hypothetical protein JDF658_01620 [Carboxydocella sp. JDF658]